MIKVIDNVISEKYSNFIFEESVKLPWTFVPNLSYGNTDNFDSAGFSYTYFLDKQYKYGNEEKFTTRTKEYSYIIPLLLECFDKLNLPATIDNVFRCRARLTLNKQVSKVEDKHIDFNFPHLVLLYYINNTDGDTYLFENDVIVEKIQPRRGRCVLFDGLTLHASSSSTLSPRIVLNTNLNYNEKEG